MASPFTGIWQMYGCENSDFLLDGIMLPKPIKCVSVLHTEGISCVQVEVNCFVHCC